MTENDLSTSIEALVGEMPDEACESPYHDKPGTFHAGPATHYAQLLHNCSFLNSGSIYAICEPQVAYMKNGLSLNAFTTCASCGNTMEKSAWARVVGPIGNRKEKGKL